MKTPLLEQARIALHSALFYDDPDKRIDLIGEALEAIEHAIGVVDASREDAHRMAGRVEVDTELQDELTRDPENGAPSLGEILLMYPVLENAYYRLFHLDANGATMAANEIEDLFVFGKNNPESILSLANEIQATCDKIKQECE